MDTEQTWEWYIKDYERRTLPLTEELIRELAQHLEEQPQGHPYVFVPPKRYAHIQERRQIGNWTVEDGKCPINNFSRKFGTLMRKAGIEEGEFHDLHRTCLSNWLASGLSEFEVMKLAGHSSFETTHRFYLAIQDDLIDKARNASMSLLDKNHTANSLQRQNSATNKKGRHPQVIDDQEVM